ncbi:MAG: type II toxin-antitoxin system mRNA interferase toxin, RelE/StbE family [Clostridiales bacterium]|nr:type II toxin-antitoxin system mRNA interferase toxin, RelE/StbE family [Clostridiales bacterium]
MLNLVTTSQFRKDYKRLKKRGYPLTRLQKVIQTLLEGKALEPIYRDHALIRRAYDENKGFD